MDQTTHKHPSLHRRDKIYIVTAPLRPRITVLFMGIEELLERPIQGHIWKVGKHMA